MSYKLCHWIEIVLARHRRPLRRPEVINTIMANARWGRQWQVILVRICQKVARPRISAARSVYSNGGCPLFPWHVIVGENCRQSAMALHPKNRRVALNLKRCRQCRGLVQSAKLLKQPGFRSGRGLGIRGLNSDTDFAVITG